MEGIESVTTSLTSLTSIPFDWMVLIGCVVAFLLIALYSGASNVIAIALSALTASSLTPLPQNTVLLSRFVTEGHSATIDTIIFVVLFIFLALFFRWMIHDVINITSPVQALLAGIASAIVFGVVWAQTPGLTTVWQFGPLLASIFSEGYRLWLTILAVVMLAFSR